MRMRLIYSDKIRTGSFNLCHPCSIPFLYVSQMKPIICILFLSALFSCSNQKQVKNGSQTYTHAAVVSASGDASRVGVDIMKEGGNAIDAAVAVSLALAV